MKLAGDAPLAGFKKLEVWQLGRQLVKTVYEISHKLPDSERFGITQQLCRAAVSVPSNVAEGWGRNSEGAFSNHLRIARGSLDEVLTLLILAQDLGFLLEADVAAVEAQIEVLGKKLYFLTQSVQGGRVREDLAEYGG